MDFLSAGRKKVVVVERCRYRKVLNKSQCMDFLSAGRKKVVVVERCRYRKV